MRTMLWILASASVALLVTALLWSPSPPPVPLAAARAVASAPSPSALDALVRAEARMPVEPTKSDCRTFDELLDALVALAVQAQELVARGEREPAIALDRQAGELWAEVQRCVAAADERALLAVQDIDPSDQQAAPQCRRRFCQRFLAEGLAARWRRFQSSRDRAPVDTLVRALLTCLPRDATLAELLAPGLLIDQPYLGLAHEDQVLDLVSLSVEREFLRKVATGLLLTLWRNLEREGARGADELAGLALLLQGDANPARRLAALQHLLSAREGRYREVVLQEVTRSHDRALAHEVALSAARGLEPAAALDCLRRLLPIGGQRMMAAFMLLGERAPEALTKAYTDQLASGTDATLRAELVSGAAFERSGTGIDLARMAFQHDPDPDVRGRAMLALTARAASALGEQTINAALDDAALSNTPLRLGVIVLALGNLANAAETNAVDRLGRRLLARADLLDADRKRVEDLLARAVPR